MITEYVQKLTRFPLDDKSTKSLCKWAMTADADELSEALILAARSVNPDAVFAMLPFAGDDVPNSVLSFIAKLILMDDDPDECLIQESETPLSQP